MLFALLLTFALALFGFCGLFFLISYVSRPAFNVCPRFTWDLLAISDMIVSNSIYGVCPLYCLDLVILFSQSFYAYNTCFAYAL